MLRIGAVLVLIVLLAYGAQAPAAAADSRVELRLAGGEVVGPVRGEGAASVSVEVRNATDSPLTGVALEVYYSTRNAPPVDPDSADWRVHEFLFDPPLNPGQTRVVNFSDENAAEYILLAVKQAVTADGSPAAGTTPPPPAGSMPVDASELPPADGKSLLYNGSLARLDQALKERNGVAYIATRDLVNATGGGLSYDSQTYQIIIERHHHVVKVREDSASVEADGAKVQLAHKVLSIGGTSFLPLADIAPLLGLTAAFDKGTGYYTMQDE